MLVGEIRALKTKSNWEKAQKTLQDVVEQVSPIMKVFNHIFNLKKRSWVVGRVCEFYPSQKNLLGLNVNRGQEIRIRLRDSSDQESFLSFEFVLDTMLHELVHNRHGPHDGKNSCLQTEKFYGLLDELKDEYNIFKQKGYVSYTGGSRLGGTCTDVKAARLSAAEERRKRGIMMPIGGRRLGGSPENNQLEKVVSPRELALAAAERRRADDIWCGGIERKNQGERDFARASEREKQTTWTCRQCTYLNQPLHLVCNVCLFARSTPAIIDLT